MVIDIGGGTTDIAVISLGGIVVRSSIKVAGDKFDQAIITYIRKKHKLMIGERTAEDIKINTGSAFKKEIETTMEIRGRDLVTGLPKNINISSEEMREALREPVLAIVDCAKSVLERTPPELAADIYDKGISVSSMSKVFSLAGLRLGWIAASEDIIAKCFEHRDYNMISCGMLDEIFAGFALKNADKLLERNKSMVRRNLTILDKWVSKEPHISFVKPQAGTTALLYYDFEMSSRDFCVNLMKKYGVLLTPGSCFELEKCARIGYACSTEILEQGLEKVSEYLKTL
jgi:hypothetical protein